MSTTTRIRRTIDAPLDRVFDTTAHIENYAKAIEGIVGVEFLSDERVGVGTRFREKRVLKGREASAVLEVKEYEPKRLIRLESDENGTIWDSTFTFREVDGATELELVMEARAYKLLPRLLNPLFKGMIRRAVENDVDSLKAYCESHDFDEEE